MGDNYTAGRPMSSPQISTPAQKRYAAESRAYERQLNQEFNIADAKIRTAVAVGLSKPAAESPEMRALRGGTVSEEHIFHYGAQDPHNAFLDNFYPSTFRDYDGVEYRTAEHYYQSRKTADPKLREWIRVAPTAAEAKRRGQSLKPEQMVPDWETGKVGAMLDALMLKFTLGLGPDNESMMKRLMETDKKHLHEDSPGDKIWGVEGYDLLGLLQERVRASIKLMGLHRAGGVTADSLDVDETGYIVMGIIDPAIGIQFGNPTR